jgi:uncharacterized protein YqgC (DUF456 family)
MLLGLDVVAVLALALLALGVLGSAIPSVPGPLVSLAGVVAYVLGGGTGVGTVVLGALVAVGVVAVVADWLAGTLAAKYGGASWTASLLGAVVGFVAFLATGPLGFIVGLAGTIFLVEAYRENAEHATRAALYSTLGALGSVVVQVLLAFGMLVTFAVALLV